MSKRLSCFILLGMAVVLKGQALDSTIYRSTVVVYYPEKQSVGTGFLIAKEIEKGKWHVYLITNKHVLPTKGKENNIMIGASSSSRDTFCWVTIPVVDANGQYKSNVKLHPNQNYDVAAIDVTPYCVDKRIQCTAISTSLLATKDILKDLHITIGDEILLLGYPEAIYDERNLSPVLRQGIIATLPTEGFVSRLAGIPDKIDGFLIDASVFPGSSGSLVLLKRSIYLENGIGLAVGGSRSKQWVLGVVSGTLKSTATTPPQMIGLGLVFSSDVILATIEEFYK